MEEKRLTFVDVRWQATNEHLPREAFSSLATLTVRTAPTRRRKRRSLRTGYAATDADSNPDAHADTDADTDSDADTHSHTDANPDAIQLARRVWIL